MPHTPRKTPLWIGLQAARANLLPGFIVQSVMLAIVLGYYFVPSVQGVLDQVGAAKKAAGLGFAAGISVLGGAVLPELLKIACFQRGRLAKANLRTLAFTIPLWAWGGMVVDLLYRGQAVAFGSGSDVGTIAAKVACDQFVFNPCYAGIVNTVAYDLLARGYTWGNFRSCCTWAYYKDRVIPTLLATWGVWIPLVAIIYALPDNLQIPLFGLALTFWALMLAYMNAAKPEAAAPREEAFVAEGASS